MNNIYEKCPVLKGNLLTLTLIQKKDAKDLLKCYEDPKAVAFMNSDNCDDNFHYTTLERMNQAVDFWMEAYNNGWFVRLTIKDKKTDFAIGTIEIFRRDEDDAFGNSGFLRIDLNADYEKKEIIDDILSVSLSNFYKIFQVNRIITKAVPEAVERVQSLKEHGFIPMDEKLMDKYGDYFICVQ